MIKASTLLLFAWLLCACALPGLYTANITQGNIVDGDKVQQLQEGMNAQQVLFLLGTPLLRDTFNPERWDYLYLESRSDGTIIERRHGHLLFADGLLRVISMDEFIDG